MQHKSVTFDQFFKDKNEKIINTLYKWVEM